MKKAEQSVATAHNLSPGNGTCSLRHYSYIVGRGLNRDVGLKKMNIIWLLVVASVSAGCLSLSNKEGSPNRWTAGELVGNTFTLVDTTSYAQYTFHDNGDAIATIGQVDGPLAGPVMRWQITRA